MNNGALVAVTGAARGVGHATMYRLHRTGYRVIGIDRAPIAAPDRARDDDLPCCYQIDVTDRHAVERAVATIITVHGVPDIWVNNAAVGRWGPFDAAAAGSEREEMEVNYHGSLNCIRAILPHWEARRRGHLIQVSSTAALVPGPWMATYAASKSAIGAFVRSLRVELAEKGIMVSEVIPNVVDTALIEGTNRRHIPKLALLRPMLTPEQVAAAIQDGIEHRRREIRLPRLVTPFYILSALFPRVMDRLLGWGPGGNRERGTRS